MSSAAAVIGTLGVKQELNAFPQDINFSNKAE